MNKQRQSRFISLSLRLGLAFVFAYAGLDALREPNAWIGFLPAFAFKLGPQSLILNGFSISQIILAAIILWRKTSFLGAIGSILILVSIVINSVISDFNSLLITFRDGGLIFAAIALAIADAPEKFIKNKHP